MGVEKFDIWQHWNQYLCLRAEHLSHVVPQIESYTRLYNLMQEEVSRATYEWNWLQYQKLFSDWQDQWFQPSMWK